MEFEEKFVAFVDILGFKRLVQSAESGEGMSLDQLLLIPEKLGSEADTAEIKRYGPTICPAAPRIKADVGMCLTQISDCVVVSTEASPAGVITIVYHCWRAVMRLLQTGLMCRGYITRGKIHHTAGKLIGSGYQEAYGQEGQVAVFKREADERGTPFVEIARSVCDFVAECGNDCVKEMFARLVKADGDVAAVFPFQRLSHSFSIGGFGSTFDADRERTSNASMRQGILDLKKRVLEHVAGENQDVRRKADHYCAALDKQLEVCDRTDEAIQALESSFPSRRMRCLPGELNGRGDG